MTDDNLGPSRGILLAVLVGCILWAVLIAWALSRF